MKVSCLDIKNGVEDTQWTPIWQGTQKPYDETNSISQITLIEVKVSEILITIGSRNYHSYSQT